MTKGARCVPLEVWFYFLCSLEVRDIFWKVFTCHRDFENTCNFKTSGFARWQAQCQHWTGKLKGSSLTKISTTHRHGFWQSLLFLSPLGVAKVQTHSQLPQLLALLIQQLLRHLLTLQGVVQLHTHPLKLVHRYQLHRLCCTKQNKTTRTNQPINQFICPVPAIQPSTHPSMQLRNTQPNTLGYRHPPLQLNIPNQSLIPSLWSVTAIQRLIILGLAPVWHTVRSDKRKAGQFVACSAQWQEEDRPVCSLQHAVTRERQASL